MQEAFHVLDLRGQSLPLVSGNGRLLRCEVAEDVEEQLRAIIALHQSGTGIVSIIAVETYQRGQALRTSCLGAFRQMTLIALHQIKSPRHVLPLDENLEPQARPAEGPGIGRLDP